MMGALADPALGVHMGFALILLLISLIGGRITPAFTRNWLMRRGSSEGLPTLPNRFDMAVIGMPAVALAAWLAGPSGPAPAGPLIVPGRAGEVRWGALCVCAWEFRV